MRAAKEVSKNKEDCDAKKWEYKNVKLSTIFQVIEKQLNALGGEGWELVAVTVLANREWAYLKREKSQ
ncbi:MAG: DUF4177 domain-containing protein [Patescibacteria group bacterium]